MKRLRRGATRTQVLTVIVLSIVGLAAFALGTPLLLFLRESSRRTLCADNLKRYGLAIHTYHDFWRKIPCGAQEVRGMGPSFQIAILPMMEQEPLYQKYQHAGNAIGNAVENESAAEFGDGIVLPYAVCPSSSLPRFISIQTKGGKQIRHQLSSYVGIAGADDFGPKYAAIYYDVKFAGCCSDLSAGNPQQGIMAVNGAMIVNGYLNFGAVRDGLSNTLFMSEQSGSVREPGKNVQWDASSPHGWIAGTADGRSYDQLSIAAGKTKISSVFNLTTIVYQPGSTETNRPGIAAGHGPNNPLFSGHSGSFAALHGDVSVHHFPYQIDLILLKKLAVRADNLPLR
ncbi:MAG: DUF1559 domain-containing protein [Planctomycetales bacterium]|nr:DUF1559 domain-containing protein [Planctomycetales bacterium]